MADENRTDELAQKIQAEAEIARGYWERYERLQEFRTDFKQHGASYVAYEMEEAHDRLPGRYFEKMFYQWCEDNWWMFKNVLKDIAGAEFDAIFKQIGRTSSHRFHMERFSSFENCIMAVVMEQIADLPEGYFLAGKANTYLSGGGAVSQNTLDAFVRVNKYFRDCFENNSTYPLGRYEEIIKYLEDFNARAVEDFKEYLEVNSYVPVEAMLADCESSLDTVIATLQIATEEVEEHDLDEVPDLTPLLDTLRDVVDEISAARSAF